MKVLGDQARRNPDQQLHMNYLSLFKSLETGRFAYPFVSFSCTVRLSCNLFNLNNRKDTAYVISSNLSYFSFYTDQKLQPEFCGAAIQKRWQMSVPVVTSASNINGLFLPVISKTFSLHRHV